MCKRNFGLHDPKNTIFELIHTVRLTGPWIAYLPFRFCQIPFML